MSNGDLSSGSGPNSAAVNGQSVAQMTSVQQVLKLSNL
ncbi:hypothetical protein L914_11665 [Phytophthora nicotianae]|uniref:Uncharacterized protein n=1 Tax=Phytophthora nicotianae TaxID=4792 RepID=W2N2B5_PHYNI|nr:hypothetical protein L914_11665 [Phytophthora nicotianae]